MRHEAPHCDPTHVCELALFSILEGKGSEMDSYLLGDSFRWEGPQPLGGKAEQPLQPRF